MIRKLSIFFGILALAACGDIKVEIDTDDDGDAEVSIGDDKQAIEKSLPARGPGAIIAATTKEHWVSADPDNTLYIDIPQGRIVVLLTPDLAQGHVDQVKKLAREEYYDGLNFYRVIEGFVAQGGDASDEGAAKPIKTAATSLPAEFDEPIPESLDFTPLGNIDGYAQEAGYINGFPAGLNRKENKVWLAHCSGAFAFGRNNERDSASTEFYIALQPQRYLDRNLTVFGRVIWGMEHVQSITRGAPGNGGVIAEKARWTPISSIRVAADLPEGDRLPLEWLDTSTDIFRELIDARRNRPEEFFYFRPNYLDLCQLALPVRLTPGPTSEDEAE